MQDIKLFLAKLSHHPGVYQMLDERGDVIYVGKAKDLKKRVASYFSKTAKDPKTLSLVQQIHDITITVTTSENEAVLLECNLIKKFKPRYNILLRDDKSYPYIHLSAHLFPKIELYRGARKIKGQFFGPYPSALAVREIINLIQKIFKLRTCSDSYYEARSRPCLLYQINRCTGPCVDLISPEEYAQNVHLAIMFLEGKNHEIVDELQNKMQLASDQLKFENAAFHRDQINRIRQIQDKQYVSLSKGEADVIGLAMKDGMSCIQLLTIRQGQVIGSRAYYPKTPADTTEEEILAAFITQHYLTETSHVESIPKEIIIDKDLPDKTLIENALRQQASHKVDLQVITRGDKQKWLQMAMTSARQSLILHLSTKVNAAKQVRELELVLNLTHPLHRFECFDISHMMGEATVASCVVFSAEGPVKSDYRRYNIQGVTPGDDIGAMRQVLQRRFKAGLSEDAVIPDLVFIDGGPTQLKAASEAIDPSLLPKMLLVGIAKGRERKPGLETLHFLHQPPIHLPSDSGALHLIQQIRDEAHRFAITGHRQRRDKVRRQSSLESIEGIGAKKRRDLLRYFGGIQGIAHASLDELMKVPGINRSLAERIFAAFHDATI